MNKGDKNWPNTWTEIEDLGGGKFAATISVGHRVFFDKADGNKPKKHKLTDERPAKDYVLIQSAKCCVEIYPYYAKYFDVQHEEVRLYEERWVVQRWRDPPGKWDDVGAWNPVISVEEYPEPAGDVVKGTVAYDTDYGVLTVEYFQRDGNALKHNVYFQNTSGSTETFRVLQRWAGIAGAKVNNKDVPVVIDEPYLAFHDADKPAKQFSISENLYSMVYNPDGTERVDQRLQLPITIETSASGLKADFIYGNWVLDQNESLGIDPNTATLDDPTEDGQINFDDPTYTRAETATYILMSTASIITRGYAEWDISTIGDGATITSVHFKFHRWGTGWSETGYIKSMENKPSTSSNETVHGDVADGTQYWSGFWKDYGEDSDIDLGASAVSDLQSRLTDDWFAIGCYKLGAHNEYIYCEEKATANPKPTLYVEYTPAVTRRIFITHT